MLLPATFATPRLGVNYLSKYHEYDTPDEIMDRDFELFKSAGITDVSISLYWYRLEGDRRGDHDGGTVGRGLWGDSFLENVRHFIRRAHANGIRTMVTIHTLWGSDSEWCTPDYAIDPLSGKPRGISVIRNNYARDGFIETVTRTVDALREEEGIWSWAILNEPWYWPHELPAPYDNIDQFENFVSLIQTLSSNIKQMDDRPVVIRFNNVKIHGNEGDYAVKDIFEDDFRYDPRVFNSVDIVGFNVYRPSEDAPGVEEILGTWTQMTHDHFEQMEAMGKRYMITEMGYPFDDDSTQNMAYSEYWNDMEGSGVEAVYSWQWSSEGTTSTSCLPGDDYNLCSDFDGSPRPAFWTFSSWGMGAEWMSIDLEKGLNLIGWLGSDQSFSEAFRTAPGITKVWRRDDGGTYSYASYISEEKMWWSPDDGFTGLDYGGAYFMECSSSCTLIVETGSGPTGSISPTNSLLVWRTHSVPLSEGFAQDSSLSNISKVWHRNDSGGYSFSEYYPSVDLWWSPDPGFTHLERGEAYFVETTSNESAPRDVMSWHLDSWNWDAQPGVGMGEGEEGLQQPTYDQAEFVYPGKLDGLHSALRILYNSPFIQCLGVMTDLDNGFGPILSSSRDIKPEEYCEAMELLHSSFLN